MIGHISMYDDARSFLPSTPDKPSRVEVVLRARGEQHPREGGGGGVVEVVAAL